MCSGAAACADLAADGNSKRHPQEPPKKGVPGAPISFCVDPPACNMSRTKGQQEVSVSVTGMSDVTVLWSPSCGGKKKMACDTQCEVDL